MSKLEKYKNRRLYLFIIILICTEIAQLGVIKVFNIMMLSGFIWFLIEMTLEAYFILQEARNGGKNG